MYFGRFIFSVICFLFLSCTTTSQSTSKDAAHTAKKDLRHGTQLDWFGGSMDEARKLAKDSKKPLFVYWGAVWCPPCNEVKAEIFSHPKFAALMKSFIPVWLDGDSESAQLIGEQLKVNGYPTLLVLDSDGKEMLRLSETLSFAEFEQAVESAMAASRGLAELMDRAIRGQAEDADWQILASMSWYDARSIDLGSPEVLGKRKQLADLAPNDLPQVAAILNARLLAAAANAGQNASTQLNAVRESIRKSAEPSIAKIFKSPETSFAARSVLIYDFNEILEWAFATPQDAKQKKQWAMSWRTALQRIVANSTSEDERLSGWLALVKADQLISGRKEISRALMADVRKAIANADRLSKTHFERQTVIPTAAYVLQEIGDAGAARDLLLREVKRSPTPWYIYSSLSSLEEKLGNKTAALKYAAQASQSVTGKSSRVQWISGELNLVLRVGGEQAKAGELVRKLYDAVFAVSDGFNGRNWARLSSIEKKLKLSALDPDLRPAIVKYQGRCAEMVGDQKTRCETHFQNLLAR